MTLTRPLLVALLLTMQGASAIAQQTDPDQYKKRVGDEVKPYLSDCTAEYTANGIVDDPGGLAACKVDQAQFADEYYDALEGAQNEKFDVAFMFQRGPLYGVKYNATMACAWWIEMVDTGGRLPVNIFDKALAQACSASSDAVDKANALYAEEQRVSNLTY